MAKSLPPAGAWIVASPLPRPRMSPFFSRDKLHPMIALVLGDGRVLVRDGAVFDDERMKKEGGRYFYGKPVVEDDLWDGAEWRTIPKAMADELSRGGRISSQGAGYRLSEMAGDGARHHRNAGCMIGLDERRVLVFGGSRLQALPNHEYQEHLVAPTWIGEEGSIAWQPAGDLTYVRKHGAAALLPGGRVMFLGGMDGKGACAHVEIWEPA